MKRFLVAFVALATTYASADCLPETLLAGARDAQHGLKPGPVRQALERCFADATAKEADRATAAYLLTLAEDADLLDPQNPQLAYLAENEERLGYLGEESRLRTLRLVGDNGYENAKFPRAQRAYRTLVDEASGELREYAVTKLGWTYLNTKDGTARARRLWAEETEKRLEAKESPQVTWLHGWAQALVESRDRRDDDVAVFCSVSKEDDARQAVVKGATDALPAVTQPGDLRRLGESLATCPPIYQAWLAESGDRFAGTTRACQLVAMITPGTESGHAAALVEGCRARLVSRQENPAKLSDEARESLLSLKAADDKRQAPFAIAVAAGAHDRACFVAIDALEARAKNKISGAIDIDPKAAAAACQAAITAKPKFAGEVADRLETAAFVGDRAALEDPRVYLTARLLEQPAFRDAFLPRLADAPGKWRDTVYPALVAERLRGADGASAQKLYDAYAAANDGKVPSATAGVWEDLRIERVTKALDESRFDDALATLRRDAPAAGAQGRALRLWLRALIAAPKESLGSYGAEVEAVAKTALDSKEGRERLAGLELLARADRMDAVILALPKLGVTEDLPLLSDAIVAAVFDAAVKGSLPADLRVKGPELQATIDAGRSVGAGKVPTPGKAKGNRALPQAVAKLSAFAKSAEKAAAAKGDGTAVVSRWVDVLGAGQRLVEKTPWPHDRLAGVARTTLYAFCHGRAEALPKVRRPSQLSAAEWGAVTEELGKQLGACAAAHAPQGSAGATQNGGAW